MKRLVFALLSLGAVMVVGPATFAGPVGQIVIERHGVAPAVLHTTTGARIEFQNRTGRAVHLEFEGDARLHEVTQAPATGPFWVIFNQPGSHRYVVHVYEATERTLAGVVEVAEDPTTATPALDCGAAATGTCVER